MKTVFLLILSNVFMTFAWYGHLKFKNVPLWQVIVALAYLGGWAGSKTRAPGVTVIARGWRDVTAYLRGKRRAAQRARRRLTTPPDDGAAQ